MSTLHYPLQSSKAKKTASRQKKQQQSGQKNVKSPNNKLNSPEIQNLQNLSPNIERIRPDQVIAEDFREDSWHQKPFQTIDASEIKPKENLDSNLGPIESHDSSLSFKFHNKKQNKMGLNENALSVELFKSIKSQIQNGLNDDDKKKKKLQSIKKDKENKFSEKTYQRRLNVEQMKQEMVQKMEGKNLARKLRKPLQQQDQQQKDYEMQKLKKQQSREQWQREKEERHECIELVKEAFKHPIKPSGTSSNSQTRQREASKSQSRPFSAKLSQGEGNQHLLVKVPPVKQESSKPYDAVYSQEQYQEPSPIKDNKYESHRKQEDHKAKLTDFMVKQKRERSRKKKKDENNEATTHQKKEQALKLLQEQCMKRFENYKQNFQLNQKGRLKKHKNPKSQRQNDNQSHEQNYKKGSKKRSKSKLKIDQEKDNRRVSKSPKKQNKEIRSGTKSRSDKKKYRKQINQVATVENLHDLQKNVFNLMCKGQKQQAKEGGLNQKAQTLTNLHQEVKLLPKNQILLSKAKLKEIMLKKQSSQTTSRKSNNESQINQEPQVNQNKRIHKDDNPLIQSHPEGLQQIMSADGYRQIFMSQQQQELTPIVENKACNAKQLDVRSSQELKNHEGIKPIDSLQSFRSGINQRRKEDLTKDDTEYQQHYYKGNQQKSQNHFNKRYGSIEDPASQPKKSAARSGKQTQNQVLSPQKSEKRIQESNSKPRKAFNQRKGSAGQKKNQQPLTNVQQPVQEKVQKAKTDLKSQTLRPRSANVAKLNLVDLLQQHQQKRERNNAQSQELQLQQLNNASSIVQKYLRGFLAKRNITLMIEERQKNEKDFQLIKEKYGSPQDQKINEREELKLISPIEKAWPEEQYQMQFNNNIDILEESKSYIQEPVQKSQTLQDFSKVSKSEANLRSLLAQEQSNVNKQTQQRPNSSGFQKAKNKNLDQSSKSSQFVRRSQSNSDKQIEKNDFKRSVTSDKHSREQESAKQESQEFQKREPVRKISEIINQDSRRDSFLNSLMNDSFTKPKKSLHNKSLTSRDQQSKQSKQRESNKINSKSSIFGTEDKDVSWQFERKSFRDFFEHNSHILNEESKRQSIGNLNQSGSQSNFQNKLHQYETYLNEMEQRTEKGKEELQRLTEKTFLSPASQKKKHHLEKWVSKQEEKLSQKKKWVNENMNDLISKMDQDLQMTKKILDSSRKHSLKFNTSHEWSQHDMSLGHITSSSIHSTPRVHNMGGSSTSFANNLSSFANNKTDRGDQVKPKKLFDYQILIKKKIGSTEQQYNIVLEEEKVKEETKVIDQEKPDTQESQVVNEEDIKIEVEDEHQKSNIFEKNHLQNEDEYNKRESLASQSSEPRLNGAYDYEEAESLSKQEPPQFQSPKFTGIQPIESSQQQSTDKKQQPFTLQSKGNQENQTEELSEDKHISEAFLALKEPEHPISIDEAVKMKEACDQQEMQTEILTDYILGLLLEQMKANMFPRRAIVPIKSPAKEETHQQNSDERNDSKERGPECEVEEQKIQESPAQIVSVAPVPKKKRARGIQTSMRIVDSYLAQIFRKVKESEDEFIENLSTPLNKDPLEILLHLQNAFLESDAENAVAFQQSVLPVDLYLDLERNKAEVQAQENNSDDEEVSTNKSMMGEWENIHNKVIFDAINEALDNYRPYGLRGPPMPWSQSTRTLTYKNGQQVDMVLRQVRGKVMEWSRTFSGALPCSELLQEYGIKGPLDEDKLNMLREERLALVLAAEIEENEVLWTDYEYEETQTKLDVADMVLEFLAEEAVNDLNKIQQQRQQYTNDATCNKFSQ